MQGLRFVFLLHALFYMGNILIRNVQISLFLHSSVISVLLSFTKKNPIINTNHTHSFQMISHTVMYKQLV